MLCDILINNFNHRKLKENSKIDFILFPRVSQYLGGFQITGPGAHDVINKLSDASMEESGMCLCLTAGWLAVLYD